MILHLLTDEKFTDYAIRQFQMEDYTSEFVLIPSNFLSGESEVSLISECRIVGPNSPDFEKLLDSLYSYTGIIFHGLFWGQWQSRILEHKPTNVKFAWEVWGGDLYNRSDIYFRFFRPISKSFLIIHQFRREKIGDNNTVPKELLSRFDYCLTCLPEEYQFAYDYVENPKMEFLWHSYYSLEDTIGEELMNCKCKGNDIWLCNSAAIESNIFDGLYDLTRLKLKGLLKGSKIIVPLSYGSPWIRNRISVLGRLLFGRSFEPLTHYLPLQEYNAKMLSCSTMILPYYMPAAQGNIITALWLGMRVYLSEKNMAYRYFKSIGCSVYSIEKDLMRRSAKNQFAILDGDIVEHNRRSLIENYSREVVLQKCRLITEALS